VHHVVGERSARLWLDVVVVVTVVLPLLFLFHLLKQSASLSASPIVEMMVNAFAEPTAEELFRRKELPKAGTA
jgi:hypothetical protein